MSKPWPSSEPSLATLGLLEAFPSLSAAAGAVAVVVPEPLGAVRDLPRVAAAVVACAVVAGAGCEPGSLT